MGHFTAPLLAPRVVAELIGLSPASLRRWDEALLPKADRRPRRYSWAEVEILQRAVHQASGRGGSPAAFHALHTLEPSRTRSRTANGRARRGVSTRRRRARRGVVTVGLPHSARRRERAIRH